MWFKNRWVFIICIMLVIVELVVLLFLVAIWRLQRDNQLAPTQKQMCYPQVKLILDLDDNTACPVGLVSKFDETKKETTCCGKLSEVLNSVLNKSVFDRYNSKINPEIRTYNPEAFNCKAANQDMSVTRLTLAQDKKSVPVDSSHKLYWESDPALPKLSGLRYSVEDGQVFVEETEIYHILLQLKLNMSKTTGVLDEKIRHKVHFISDSGASAVLLEDVTSPCTMTSGSGTEKASVVEAVFRLKYGDRLYVSTTHPESIVTDPQNNHFSIYRV
ncbi:uncharacterized protein LOC132755393 [Ruditapes philippinarum]|uniref:uncharacterized protein LOC132755393 n=1 Tax=Ruditapes philippinarum TaxID=129788 RepID=UPI00295B365B|nr:uncharacterized protein LOC132755393 [Ruditapes philippinarum]